MMSELNTSFTPYVLFASGVYALTLLAAMIIFIVNWARLRQYLTPYHRYAWLSVGILFFLEIVIVILNRSTMLEEGNIDVVLGFLFIADIVVVLCLAAMTLVGLYYAALLEQPLLPYIAPRLKPKLPYTATEVQALKLAQPYPPEPYVLRSETQETSREQASVTSHLSSQLAEATAYARQHGYKAILIITGLAIVFSIILLKLSHAMPSPFLGQMSDEPSTLNNFSLLLCFTAFIFAFAEEIIFRLGIQNFLSVVFGKSASAQWAAISIASLLWAFGHAGTLHPEWAKFTQIFVLGLGLGWLNKRFGIESAILSHALFNIVMLPLGFLLFDWV